MKSSWQQFAKDIQTRPQRIPLPFQMLLAELQNKGFVIGVDHYLRLHALLNGLNLDDGRPPDDLKTLLCPIFAVNADQQALFYQIFEDRFPLHKTPVPSIKIKETQSTAAEKEAKPGVPEKSISHWRIVLAAVLWIVMIALFANLYIGRPDVPELKATTIEVKPIVKPDPEMPRKDDLIVSIPIAAGIQPEATFYQQYGRAIRWTAGLAPFVLWVIFLIVRAMNQNLAAQRHQGGKPPFRWPLKVEPVRPRFLNDRRFFKIASRLNQRIFSNIQWLDIHATIASTIRHCGFPDLQYRPATQPPEYLALIDQAGAGDHFAAFAAGLCTALSAEGLFVKTAGFSGDPRICFDSADGRRFKLADLARRYPNHRLILIGNGERIIDADTGSLPDWAAMFASWPQRALLTPVPAAQWSMREVILARLFVLKENTEKKQLPWAA